MCRYVGHKGSYGMVRKGAGTKIVNGGRCAQNGRPERGALADHDGSGRDVAALYPGLFAGGGKILR